ncbi:MAG: N-acetylmuramidase family protein [Alphaproteobacteria bacterium]|nr:N-acetylmuramidase family protein [Alphaproteobacteria bacterium]
MEFVGTATRLAADDVAAAAASLQCEPAAIWAVCDVESAGGGFLPDGRPKILFEAHVFGRLTAHRWDAAHPNVSAPAWNRSLYGAAGAHQYDRLAEAIALDRAAALQAASWGMFQILGLNHTICGFADIEAYVAAMCAGEGAQLDAFAAFCRHGGLDQHLRAEDWTAFALAYNGPGEAENDYDAKLAAAYDRRAAAQS